MKKICLVARQNILNANGGGYHNDEGRRALDGIRYGAVKEIEDNVNPLSIWHQLRQEFEVDNPGWRVDSYFIRLEDGSEIECSDKLRMQTANKADENFRKLAAMFPNAVTETINENGEVVRAIDKDVLMQEINTKVVDGKEERYQFTWPDKKKSVLLANAPINKTLRPVREDETVPTGADSEGKPYCSSGSVNFDTTENLYIEGDNLEVLKLLQETYLGKIKMIYIDPPYNTGSDFVYEDDFAQSTDEYLANSGQFDGDGNRMVQNTESNGRFHTDWLNMIYPRLKLAKDLLTDDGVVFISLDDNEIYNCKKTCDDIFGADNFICNFVRKNKAGSGHDSSKIAIEFDYIMCYAKNNLTININQEKVDTENDSKYRLEDEYVANRGRYYLRDLDYKGSYSEKLDYGIKAPDGTIIYSGDAFGKPNTWRWSKEKFEWGLKNGYIVFKKANKWKVYIKQYQFADNSGNLYKRTLPYRAIIEFLNGQGTTDFNNIMETNAFSYPKSVGLLSHLLKIGSHEESIILDFFSGSATTAHAVMQLNAEDGGHRKFIMVQLPEVTDEKSEAYKAGYKNICEIGKERIRRAGQKIRNEQLGIRNDVDNSSLLTPNSSLDIGFRVLKCDTSNMKEVYYNPAEYEASLFSRLEDNIKEDRTPEDLLFQVMLDLGILLSSKIQVRSEKVGMRSYSYFDVEDGYLIACFDKNIDEEVITAIAKQKPYYFVMRDSSMANDSVATNFDQIFATYSPDTVRKVL